MNTAPRLHWLGNKTDPTYNPGCGLMAVENVAMAFWQSRMTAGGRRAEPPQLLNIEAFARELRKRWQA